MKKNSKSTFFGALIIILVFVFSVFLIFGSYIYQDMKKVEQNVFNLYQQIKATNSKIDQFSVAGEPIAQQSMKFTEATKNWQIYQNEEFNFQLKSPASWGNLNFYFSQGAKAEEQFEVQEKRLSARFSYAEDDQPLELIIATYGLNKTSDYPLFADKEVKQALLENKVGECSHELFAKIKALSTAEIRNCFVRENILKQRFIIFRRVLPLEEELIDELLAVYPRDDYYLTVKLPDEISDEVDYFIQSIVFMN